MNTEQDQPEPLAAILAEMRAAGRSGEHADGPLIEDFADRIEAAAEREREELIRVANETMEAVHADARQHAAPGNADAMREALERIVEWADRYVGRLCFHGPSPEMDGWRTASHAANDALALARVAIDAPARNCDRFKTLDEAREAFQDLRGHKILADVELWDSMDEAGALVRWLFAPAKEGGAK